MIDVRSSRGKNAKGHKITALAVHGDKLLVTSNDSRIRMYDLRDMNLTCKFKGAVLENSHIRASFSPDGKHIISGELMFLKGGGENLIQGFCRQKQISKIVIFSTKLF